MPRENRGLIIAVESAIDIFINALSLLIAYFITAYIRGAVLSITDGGLLLFILILLLFLSVYYHLIGIYLPIPRYGEGRLLSRVVLAEATALPIVLVVEAFLLDGEKYDFAALWTLLSAIVATLLLLLEKRMVIRAVRYLRRRSRLASRVMIIGDNLESAVLLLREVERLVDSGATVIGCVGIDMRERGFPYLGELSDACDAIDGERPDAVVFALTSYEREWLIDAVNRADDRCARVYFLPVIHGYFKSSSQITAFGMLPLVNAHATPLDAPSAAFIKRAFDIVGSLALIILTMPVMLVAVIGVKLSSPGPILFRQTRVGRAAKPFTMYKLRSMRQSATSDIAWSTGCDPRTTRFGSLIRRTSIDELPQLFNVLLGDMSLVGPRPEIPHFVERFKRTVPLYMVKHYVRPGMTGLAQIKGLRGDTSIEDRIAEDIHYIENWSISLDLYVLFKTPFAALNKNEVYGGGE